MTMRPGGRRWNRSTGSGAACSAHCLASPKDNAGATAGSSTSRWQHSSGARGGAWRGKVVWRRVRHGGRGGGRRGGHRGGGREARRGGEGRGAARWAARRSEPRAARRRAATPCRATRASSKRAMSWSGRAHGDAPYATSRGRCCLSDGAKDCKWRVLLGGGPRPGPRRGPAQVRRGIAGKRPATALCGRGLQVCPEPRADGNACPPAKSATGRNDKAHVTPGNFRVWPLQWRAARRGGGRRRRAIRAVRRRTPRRRQSWAARCGGRPGAEAGGARRRHRRGGGRRGGQRGGGQELRERKFGTY